MSIFKKLLSLFKIKAREVDEAIDDKFGAEIFEQQIIDSKEAILKAKDAMRTHQAYINTEKSEIDGFNEEIEGLQSELDQQKKLFDAAESDEEKDKHKGLAMRVKKALDQVKLKSSAKLEAFEMAQESIEENNEMIASQESEIEIAELEISTIKAQQAAIQMNKKVNNIGSSLGGGVGGDKDVLERTKRKQKEQMEKIKLDRQAKKSTKKTLAQDLAASKTDDSDPWG